MTTRSLEVDATASEAVARAEVRQMLAAYEPRWPVRCDAWMRSFDEQFSHRLAEASLIGVTWPEEAGGRGLSNTVRLAITEELLRAAAPVAAHWVADRQIGPAVLRHGSEALRSEILPGITSAEMTFCLGMSEPDSGSDLAAVKTRAVLDAGSGSYRITGSKIWTSNAHRVSHIYVLARTDSTGRKHDGLTEFIVPMDAEGLSTRPILDLSGEHHFNETIFDDVEVPVEHVIGRVGHGWEQVTEQLAFERGGAERYLSTYPVLAALLGAGGERTPAFDDAAVRRIGSVLVELLAVRGLAAHVARRMDGGHAPTTEAAQLKFVGTALEKEILRLGADLSEQPHLPRAEGLSGLVADGLFSSPGGSLRGGTSEILLTVLARAETAWLAHDDPDIADLMTSTSSAVSGLKPDHSGVVSSAAVWKLARDLGWHRIGTPEEHGGSGGDLRDLIAVVQATSASGLPTPYASSAASSLVAARAGRPPGHDGLTSLTTIGALRGRVHDGCLVLDGSLDQLSDARDALDALVPVDVGGVRTLVQLPLAAAGVEVSHQQDLAGDPVDRITCRNVTLPAESAMGSDVFGTAETVGRLIRAARIVGLSEGALDQVRRYVGVRHQFGRPLVAFQTVSHQLAQAEARVAVARSALWSTVELENPSSDRAQAALACALGTVWSTATASHQLLGAMGTTLEHPLHRFTLRLHACRTAGERATDLEDSLGEAALGRGEEATWDWIVGSRPALSEF